MSPPALTPGRLPMTERAPVLLDPETIRQTDALVSAMDRPQPTILGRTSDGLIAIERIPQPDSIPPRLIRVIARPCAYPGCDEDLDELHKRAGTHYCTDVHRIADFKRRARNRRKAEKERARIRGAAATIIEENRKRAVVPFDHGSLAQALGRASEPVLEVLLEGPERVDPEDAMHDRLSGDAKLELASIVVARERELSPVQWCVANIASGVLSGSLGAVAKRSHRVAWGVRIAQGDRLEDGRRSMPHPSTARAVREDDRRRPAFPLLRWSVRQIREPVTAEILVAEFAQLRDESDTRRVLAQQRPRPDSARRRRLRQQFHLVQLHLRQWSDPHKWLDASRWDGLHTPGPRAAPAPSRVLDKRPRQWRNRLPLDRPVERQPMPPVRCSDMECLCDVCVAERIARVQVGVRHGWQPWDGCYANAGETFADRQAFALSR